MARPGSKMKAGYLPIEERHYPALLSLVAPATPSFAGPVRRGRHISDHVFTLAKNQPDY
jgi:hypothetical protein